MREHLVKQSFPPVVQLCNFAAANVLLTIWEVIAEKHSFACLKDGKHELSFLNLAMKY